MSDSSAKKTSEDIRDYLLADAFDEARKSGGKHLSLRYMELEEVPKQVWSFENLESLDLSSNKLRSVPKASRNSGD